MFILCGPYACLINLTCCNNRSGGGKSTNGSSHGHGNNSSNAIWSPSVRHAQRGHDNVGNEQERDRSDRSILILSSFSSSNSNNTGSASNNKLYMDFFEDREGGECPFHKVQVLILEFVSNDWMGNWMNLYDSSSWRYASGERLPG